MTSYRGMIVILLLVLIVSGCGGRTGTPGGGSAPGTGGGANGSSSAGSGGTNVQPPADGSGGAGNAPGTGESEQAPADPVLEQLGKLSTDEKIGQLVLVGMEGTEINQNVRDLIEKEHVGGFIFYKDNIQDKKQALALFNALKAANRDQPVPLFLSVDEEGGRVSRMPGEFAKLPAMRAIGDIGSEELAGRIGGVIGKELSGFGLNLDFAPVLDVNSNPDNPVIGDRAFGVEPEIVSKMGIAVMNGIREQGVIPVVKHFPGHGDTAVDSHLGLPVVEHDLDRLRKLELVPFARAIKEDADVVMIAHLLLPKLDPDHPASFSEPVIHGLLREELQFKGTIISDDMTMGAIVKNYDIGEAAVQFLLAGGNIVLVGHNYDQEQAVIQAIREAVASGKISAEELDDRVYNVLKLKAKYALAEKPASGPDLKAINREIRSLLEENGLK
ncbi:beta-N-acetylhexosaminidase [Paenibacillus sp. TH7-28]